MSVGGRACWPVSERLRVPTALSSAVGECLAYVSELALGGERKNAAAARACQPQPGSEGVLQPVWLQEGSGMVLRPLTPAYPSKAGGCHFQACLLVLAG